MQQRVRAPLLTQIAVMAALANPNPTLKVNHAQEQDYCLCPLIS
jgi:hypothetical protein